MGEMVDFGGRNEVSQRYNRVFLPFSFMKFQIDNDFWLICYCNNIHSVVQSLCDVMEMIILSSLVTAFNLYVFELNDALNLEIIAAFFDLVIALVITFINCYLSEQITTALFEIGDNFYDMPWYQLSTKQQKGLVFPIQRAQRELRLTGLGLVDCTLGLYSTV